MDFSGISGTADLVCGIDCRENKSRRGRNKKAGKRKKSIIGLLDF